MRDRRVDGLQIPAPKPVVIIEVWIPGSALGARAMTLRAIDLVVGPSRRNGKAAQLLVRHDLAERRNPDPLKRIRTRFFDFEDFLFELTTRGDSGDPSRRRL